MKKLLKELENLDIENLYRTRKLLAGLHGDIQFFGRRQNKKVLMEFKQILDDFVSINTKELYKSYRKQRLLAEMQNLIALIDKLLER